MTGQGENSIALGYQAGMTGQGANAVALGYQAGLYDQSANAIAIGYQAGMTGQGENSIALGYQAGMSGQGENAIAIGYQAGMTGQSANAIAIGYQAGMTGQGANAVALGYQAGLYDQSSNTIAIGYQAGMTGQGENSIALGYQAGMTGQGANAVALGYQAGLYDQSSNAIAIGYQAGMTGQGANSIALGYQAGLHDQSANAIAIGYQAGMTGQGENAIAIGYQAGMTGQGANAIAFGYQAGMTGQGENSIAFGYQAGLYDQSSNAIAIGYQAGMTGQGQNAIALGYQAGLHDQSANAIAIGYQAGMTGQGENSIALGYQAGMTGQGANAVALGYQAGLYDQSSNAIAIGYQAGMTGQSLNSIALGYQAGLHDQSANAIAIGYQAGMTGQSLNSVALGYQAGMTGQGENAIAIGYQAGTGDQAANTIILNATDASLNSVGDASACYIKPIRNVDTDYNSYEPLAYNKSTGELVSGNNVGFQMITDSFSVTGGGGSGGIGGGDDKLFAYSYDGITWSQDESATAKRTFTDGSCNAIAYDGSVWLAGGVGENAIVHSANGITWERNDDNARSVLDSGNWRAPVDISYSLTGTEAGEAFGTSLALNSRGNRMAVGVPNFTSSDISGVVAIYDFSFNSDAWIKTFDISGASTALSERFGASVVMDGSGTRIAVGAPHYGPGQDDGIVYTFDCSYNDASFNPLSTFWGNGISINAIGSNEKFGSTIAMNATGTRLLIGAPNNGDNEGKVYSLDYSASAHTWERTYAGQFFEIQTTDGYFGYSIAMNAAGTRCLIGEPDNGTGHVYGYDFSMSTGYWGLTTTGTSAVADQDLAYNPAVFTDSFGHAITMNDAGDWCAVGAPTAGSGRGAVGIYRNNYRAWELYTDISGQVAGENFGSSVAMNGLGDRLIIGATKNSGDPGQKGKNYVYNYNANTLAWEYERVISSNTLTDGNEGTALAIDTLGNRFVSGAPTGDGSVVVYDRQMKCNDLIKNGANWIGAGNKKEGLFFSNDGISDWKKNDLLNNTSYFEYLYNSLSFKTFVNESFVYGSNTLNSYGLKNGAQFGYSVALNASGTIMAVGAVLDWYTGSADNGAVVLFQWNGSAWTQMGATLYGDTATYGLGTGSQFGYSVALNASGTILAVGAKNYSSQGGAVVLFQWNGSSSAWDQMGSTLFYDDYGLTTTALFGHSVALNASGTILAVGAVLDDTGSTNNGAVVLFQWNGSSSAWTQMGTTLYGDATYSLGTTANFGVSVALNASGTILAVGAAGYSAFNGAVVLFQWNGSSAWDQMGATLYGGTGSQFGFSVALNASGTILAVGAIGHSSLGGAVVLFQWNGSSSAWTQMGSTLFYNNYGLTTTALFGYSVALNASGTILAVGAPYNDTGSADNGAVVLFTTEQFNYENNGLIEYNTIIRDTTSTTSSNTLLLGGEGTTDIINISSFQSNDGGSTISLKNVDDFGVFSNDLSAKSISSTMTLYNMFPSYGLTNTARFGWSVALNASGTILAVGARGYSTNSGAVVLFQWNGSAWTQMGSTLFYNNYGITTTARFGDSVALNASGTILAVGAQYNDTNNGAVVLFQWNGSSAWTQMGATLYGDATYGLGTGSYFGDSVALNASGTILAVGARYYSSGGGAVVLFQWNGSSSAWTQMGSTLFYNNYGLTTTAQFGISVALNASGTILAVGAPNNDTGGTDNGAVVTFKIEHTANRYCNAIASNKNIIIAAGGPTEYSSTLVYSINQGETWNDIDNGSSTFPFSGKICNSVAWNGSRWVAGGRGANPLAYSYNGKKWYQSMNAGTLLGAASTCNAVSWNGKYWSASVEGDSVGGGQTQVYSLNGMSWIASNNGDTLFSGTSQALALATAKEGNEINTINLESRATTLESRATTLESRATTLESRATTLDTSMNLVESRATTLESRATTLETQQIGYNSNLYNVLASKPRGTYYENNTSKTIIVYGIVSKDDHVLLKNPSGTVFEILNAGTSSNYYNNLTFFVPPGWEYYLPSGGSTTRNRLHEFY
jgi:hypothetical protein